MKKCKCCGVEIVNGENGCAMAGNVCFQCRPWNMNKIAPARNHFANNSPADHFELAILTRQDASSTD